MLDKIIEISEGTKKAKCIKVACADAKEMDSAAKWAANELSKNANQRIGILVPELNSAVQPTAWTIRALAQYNCPTDVISLRVSPLMKHLNLCALGLINLCKNNQTLEEWLQLLYFLAFLTNCLCNLK